MIEFLHNPVVHTVILGALSGLAVDLHAFLAFKSLNDAKTYNYGTAALHAVQGALASLLAYGGLTAVGA